MRRPAAIVALVAALGAACSHGGADAKPEATLAPPPRAPLRGRVVDRLTRAGLAGRVVIAAGRRTTTAADGSFALPDVPALYDLVIVDAGGERASVYQKLSRRDPVLVHAAPGPVDEWRAQHGARIYAHPTIDGRPAPQSPDVGFFSPVASGVGHDVTVVHWNGPASLDGDLLAAVIEDGGRGWVARRPLRLAASSAETIQLPLAAMPDRRVRGALVAPAGFHVLPLFESYRLPIPGAEVRIHGDDGDDLRGFDDHLPDASGLGATLCVTATADGDGATGATRCAPGADGTWGLTMDRPPVLTAPRQGAAFEPDTVFSWKRAAGGVQVLQLTGPETAADRPDVTVYTPDSAVSWQALAGLPAQFPRGCSIYQVTAGSRAPYASMDEAFGPGGVGAWIPAEARWTESPPITVTVPRWPRPQPGSFEAKLCHYPYGQGIVCGLPTKADPQGEFYVLSAINNKLRNFPELTKSIGIYCVHDCDSARRFMKALREYSRQHPNFDANEPLDMESC